MTEHKLPTPDWFAGREAGLLEATLLVTGFDFERLSNVEYILEFHGSDGHTTQAVRLTFDHLKALEQVARITWAYCEP